MADIDSEPAEHAETQQRILPENCIEYYLFAIDSKVEARKKLAQLESIRQAAISLAQQLTKEYIWQRDEFNLDLRNEQGLTYLYGITDYGDAVEDEWLIVYILRELTKSNPSVWARVADSDGEFLLVEAANVLPKWINPEMDTNRVWLHNGQLFMIPVNEKAPKEKALTLAGSVDFLTTSSAALVHSAFVEAEALYRLEKYPGHITESMHHSLITVPRKLAYALHSLPRAMAPAIESFYLRDALSLKPIYAASQTLQFPPEDLVTISAQFSRVMFAQLKSQRFETPTRWQGVLKETSDDASSADKVAYARLETGMKVTCGFEMLACKAEKHKNRVVREFAVVLEDLQEDGADALPSDNEIAAWPSSGRNDDEKWMDINYEDFERELSGQTRTRSSEAGKASGFGDAATQADLRKIVSRFEAFLNDDSAGLEGAELDDMDVDDDEDDDDDDGDMDGDSDLEDREVSFDEAEFSKMMREMMGFQGHSGANAVPASTAPGLKHEIADLSDEDDAEEEDYDDADIQTLAAQLETELKGHGALKLDAPVKGSRALKDERQSTEREEPAYGDEESSDGEVDIDYNLAKNLLESFKSQGGMSGPTGNLLGLMGIQLPRDEDDGTEEPAAGGSSKGRP